LYLTVILPNGNFHFAPLAWATDTASSMRFTKHMHSPMSSTRHPDPDTSTITDETAAPKSRSSSFVELEEEQKRPVEADHENAQADSATPTQCSGPQSTSANEKPSAVEHTETSNANEEPTKHEDGDQIPTSKDGEAAEEDQDDESKYLTGLPLIILTIGLCLTTVIIALDNTIIATAIPRITTAFNSLGDVGWYGSSYLLTTCSLQPSFGKVYTYFDVKWTYLFALILFEGESQNPQLQKKERFSVFGSIQYALRVVEGLETAEGDLCTTAAPGVFYLEHFSRN
jgi:hypothetical protein